MTYREVRVNRPLILIASDTNHIVLARGRSRRDVVHRLQARRGHVALVIEAAIRPLDERVRTPGIRRLVGGRLCSERVREPMLALVSTST